MMLKTYTLMLTNLLRDFPFEITNKQDTLTVNFSNLNKFSWKRKPAKLSNFNHLIKENSFFNLDQQELNLSADLASSEFLKIHDLLGNILSALYMENPEELELWGQTRNTNPSGFNEADESISWDLLKDVYDDDLIVKEKKPLILDLEKSYENQLVSVGPKRRSVVDGASQIASMNLGFNHIRKNPMFLRDEMLDPNLNIEEWDVYKAFCNLLKEESRLDHVYIVNSGAEAVETCLRACQTAYPDRKKVLAFEGSFHGRTLLSLHTTFNPAKRAQFEMFPGIVDFLPFPEDICPYGTREEPETWLNTWSNPENSSFLTNINNFLCSNDRLIENETLCLLKVRERLQFEKPLAILIEPMLCEGGDRFGTNRFFRALRLLSRAYDTALIFDEVQTGIGLGDRFFWHSEFDLVDKDGNPDTPDCVSIAKKSQVGVCLSRFKQDLPLEISAVSIYRGYLQSIAFFDYQDRKISEKIQEYLYTLQEILGEELVQNPRNRGLSFAFDLPSQKLVGQMISKRFPAGLLFYPAGQRTARFRMMSSSDEFDVAGVFSAIYRCFLALEKDRLIPAIPSMKEFLNALPEAALNVEDLNPEVELKLPWLNINFPKNKEEYLAISKEDYKKTFIRLSREIPQLLKSKFSQEISLDQLNNKSPDDLWETYLQNPEFSIIDLMWNSSRAFGHKVDLVSGANAEAIFPAIQKIQEELYELGRRDRDKTFRQVLADPASLFHVAKSEENPTFPNGICVAGPLKYFEDIKMISTDPYLNDAKASYSMDISVRSKMQGQGLGFRLKCEQYIEALNRGYHTIRSRNRHPEADAMENLNRRFSAVTIEKNFNDYEGNGISHYQSISLDKSNKLNVKNYLLPNIKNKSTLSNFVSPQYLTNVQIIKEILPENYKHIYLSSGRSECVDKMVKLLYKNRPGNKVLSFKGDYFGKTTAAARTLGGNKENLPFFDWPVLDFPYAAKDKEEAKSILSNLFSKLDLEKTIGVFVEPMDEKQNKKEEFALEALIEVAKSHNLSVVFSETNSAFYNYDSQNFFCSNKDLNPDGIFSYAGNQVGFLAVNDTLFLAKPLTMISTWDGDEHSLNMFVRRILEEKK